MKGVMIYIAGCMIVSPCVFGLMTGSVIITLLVIVYGAVIAVSPLYSDIVRKFWRAWYRENFRITNYLF